MPTIIKATERETKHEFKKDITKGDYGELLAKRFLSKFNGITDIEDKSGVYKYQKADIDLLVETPTNEKGRVVLGVEIKNDTTAFKNLFYETKSVISNGKVHSPGCLLVSEATFLLYIYQTFNVAIMVPLPNLNNWVGDNLKKGNFFRRKSVGNKSYMGEGYLIPVAAMAGKMEYYDGIDGLKFFDTKTSKQINYDEYEKRRQIANKLLRGKKYAELNYDKEEGWQEVNRNLYPNENRLNIPLMSISQREKLSRKKLEFLEHLYGETVNWKK